MKIAIIAATCFLLTACFSSKVQTIYHEVEYQRKQLKEMMGSLEELDKQREEKWMKGELDEKTDSAARDFIEGLKDSIALRLQRYDALADPQALRGNKKEITAHLNHTKALYKNELENIVFFDDLFDASTFSRLNTAAFFAAGQYKLSDSTYRKAQVIMRQIIGDALQFSGRYPQKRLRALFMVSGYADEEDVRRNGELYQTLVENMSAEPAGRKQLNRELSLRRAAFIKDILAGEYHALASNKGSNNLHVSFQAMGKGEEYPRGLVKDYQPIDERRRVVLLYWSILPQ